MPEIQERSIGESVRHLMETLPPQVVLVAAVKGRSVAEVQTAVEAGVTHIGHNYVQEMEAMAGLLGSDVRWHMIGHLQRNKVRKVVSLFDMIETVDSWKLAKELEKRCALLDKTMPVLVEVNSGREASKTGVLPEEVEDLVRAMGEFEHLAVYGLMTMGPRFGDPERARPFFQETRRMYERLGSLDLPHAPMRTLSMGMSNSYRVGIEEGANLVRIGTLIFGPREEDEGQLG